MNLNLIMVQTTGNGSVSRVELENWTDPDYSDLFAKQGHENHGQKKGPLDLSGPCKNSPYLVFCRFFAFRENWPKKSHPVKFVTEPSAHRI